MYYVGFCRLCGTGPLGLRQCGRCNKLLILCDECDAIWTSSDLKAKPFLAQSGELPCPACENSLIETPSRWATQTDIEASDWLQQALEKKQLELRQGTAFAPDATNDTTEGDTHDAS